MSMPKFVNRPDLHLTKVTVSTFSVRPTYGPHYGSQKKSKSKLRCLPLISIEVDRFFKSHNQPNTSENDRSSFSAFGGSTQAGFNVKTDEPDLAHGRTLPTPVVDRVWYNSQLTMLTSSGCSLCCSV